jgi:hypothetical protein
MISSRSMSHRAMLFLAIAVMSMAFLARFIPSTTAAEQLNLSAVVLSNGWPIKTIVLNNSGSVVFAGGENPFYADGLVLVNRDTFKKFAAFGDPVPGSEKDVFVGFLSNSQPRVALNDKDEVVFGAAFMACKGALDVWDCFDRSAVIHRGLFLYSSGKVEKVVVDRDIAPQTGGRAFSQFDNPRINNSGMIVFRGRLDIVDPAARQDVGLFSVSNQRMEKIALESEPTPVGNEFPINNDLLPLFFNEDGVITLVLGNGIVRFADHKWVRVLGMGNPAPGGGTFQQIYPYDVSASAVNERGDIAFHARFGASLTESGLFLMRSDGNLFRILAHGDPSPIGGTFRLFTEYTNRCGVILQSPASLSPRISAAGTVVFTSLVAGSNALPVVFIYGREGLGKLAAIGDPAPGDALAYIQNIPFDYLLNNLDMATFNARLTSSLDGLYGLYQLIEGSVTRLAMQGDVAPGTGGARFGGNPPSFTLFPPWSTYAMNAVGDVAFQSILCCDRPTAGIFMFRTPRPPVLNGDFETPGDGELPLHWQTAWSASNSGEAFRFSGGAAAFDGDSVLRLHVRPGGGSVFVLSDSFPVNTDRPYVVTSRMRYALPSDSDSVFLSVIQYDASGASIGLKEITGRRGDNYWTWQQRALALRTLPKTASIRIRLGLIAASESYLDVDALP